MPWTISVAYAEVLGFVVRAFVGFKSFPDDADSECTENHQQLKVQPIMSCEIQLGRELEKDHRGFLPYVKPRTFSPVTCKNKGTTEACCLISFHHFQSQDGCTCLESFQSSRKSRVQSVGLGVIPLLQLIMESVVYSLPLPGVHFNLCFVFLNRVIEVFLMIVFSSGELAASLLRWSKESLHFQEWKTFRTNLNEYFW